LRRTPQNTRRRNGKRLPVLRQYAFSRIQPNIQVCAAKIPLYRYAPTLTIKISEHAINIDCQDHQQPVIAKPRQNKHRRVSSLLIIDVFAKYHARRSR